MRLVVICLLCAGCAADGQGFIWEDRTTATQAYLDNQPIWVIGCETRISDCHERAAEICQNGYNIVEENLGGAGPGRKDATLIMQLKASCR